MYPKKDTTIYSQYPNKNTGTDQILELTKVAGSTSYNTRILMQFDISSLSSAITSGKVSPTSSYYLNLFTSKAYNLPIDYTIEAYAIAQSWTMGTGKYYDEVETTDGASWKYRAESLQWIRSGSDYITASVVSETFDYELPDARINVTPIVNSWLSSSYQNNGFLLKRPNSQESGSVEYGRLSFYSMDTNTVYLPSLEAVWDESTYITGSTQYVMSGSYVGVISGSAQMIQVGTHGVGVFIGDMHGTYSGQFSGSATGSGNAVLGLSGSLLGDYSGSVSSSLTGSYTGSYLGNFIGREDLTASISGGMSGSFAGEFNGYMSSSFLGTQMGIITGSFIPVLSGVSFEPLDSDQVSIVMKNLKPQYKYQTRSRIRFAGKDLNQRKTFAVVPLSNFSIIKYLPIGTQYSISDAYSGRVIIPFDEYTKISCDLEGNYFDLDLNGFMPLRFYKITFKIPMSGNDTFIDKNYTFKVVK